MLRPKPFKGSETPNGIIRAFQAKGSIKTIKASGIPSFSTVPFVVKDNQSVLLQLNQADPSKYVNNCGILY